MNACEACPNRHLADLFETLGKARKAEQIRAAGCNAWWVTEYTNNETGQVETVKACAWRHLPNYFNRVEALARESAETAQTHRNVVAEGFNELLHRAQVVTLPFGKKRAKMELETSKGVG